MPIHLSWRVSFWAAVCAVMSTLLCPLRSFAAAVRVYDVGDYVQHGLVGHFDAIRNVGADEAHDSNATVWKNLAGGPDAEFQYRSGSTPNSCWTDVSYYFKNDAMATTVDAIDLGTNLTVQIAITASASAQGNVNGNDRYNAWFNDNPKQNCGFWTDKQKTLVVGDFRKYINDTLTSGYRPECANWDFKYMTYMLDGTGQQCYLFQTASRPESGVDIIPLTHKGRKYCWGAEDADGNGALQAFLTGEYHSVRLYNRALSDKELVWNRKVDEARYRGESLQDTASVNIMLRSDTAAGDCADSWMGSYIVSGSHTFTAPQQVATAHDVAFVCTGYTIEKWNGSAWIAAKTHAGESSYTYNSASGEKVRVTWHWRARNALHVYDVDDYVQDGLVGHFDAIRNAGATLAHNPTATVWKNLAGGPDAEFQYRSGSAPNSCWTDKSYFFKEDAMATTLDTIDLGTNFTVQIAISATPSAQTQSTVAGEKDKSPYNAWFNDNPKNDYGFWTEGTSTTLYGNFNKLKTDPSGNVRPTISGWGGKYVTWMLDGANGKCWTFETTTIPNGKDLTVVSTKPDARKYCWGGEYHEGNDSFQAFLTGEYHSVRLYNRVLTNDELRQNRMVDEARFRDSVTGGVIPEVNVIVASSFPAVNAADACGKYVAQAGYEFKADASVCVNGTVYALDGYTLETWDADAGEWGEAIAHDDKSSYTVTDTGLVRLTWRWSKALRSIDDYDVGDYVQHGLVGHFDAIRNAGATAAHDPTATVWKNLAGGPDAEFQYRSGSTPNSCWTDKSYFFKEDAMATTVDDIDLGTNLTVQIAITANASDQVNEKDSNRYNAWFNDNPKMNCGFWTDRRFVTVTGDFRKYINDTIDSGYRPTQSYWDFKYMTYMLDGARQQCYLFQSDSRPESGSSVVDIKPLTYKARKYCWGGEDADGSGSLQAFLTGEYHSVRLYDRVLSDAELQQNRKVDEARYRGKGDVTVVNGAIGETGVSGESSLPDGVYNLEADSWTLTAQSVVVDGIQYQPRLTIETWNGSAWTDAKQIWTESYTVGKTAVAGGNIRLTWTWERRHGFMVIVK